MQADLTGLVLVDDIHAVSMLDVCQRLPLCIPSSETREYDC